MNDFTVIYRILKAFQKAMDADEFDVSMITAERFKISENRLNRILVQLYKNDYIEGVLLRKYSDENVHRALLTPEATITLKGLEYLEENSMMKKAADVLKELKDFIP